jgi:predicted anti-sigma-YlaC factor YlaD
MTPSVSCKKAAELLSQSLDEQLGVIDQLRLKFHLSICGDCRNVDAQLQQLSGLMRSPDAFNDAEMADMNLNVKNQD